MYEDNRSFSRESNNGIDKKLGYVANRQLFTADVSGGGGFSGADRRIEESGRSCGPDGS
jgi:hypothetical protein